MVTWSALRRGASGESGKKVAAAPLSKTAAAAAAAKTWFAKHPLDYMLHNRFPWKRSGRRSSMWPPYSLRRNLSAAACRPCDRSLMSRVRWSVGGRFTGIKQTVIFSSIHSCLLKAYSKWRVILFSLFCKRENFVNDVQTLSMFGFVNIHCDSLSIPHIR